MPVLDWVLLAVLLVSALLGLWRGLVYEVLSVVSWIAAFVLAQWLAPEMARYLPLSGFSESIRHAAGFVLVFVLAVFAGGLVALVVKKLVSAVGLSPVDRLLGGIFGLVRGVILLLAATLVVGMTPVRSTLAWQDSVGVGVLGAAVKGLKPVLPQELVRHLP